MVEAKGRQPLTYKDAGVDIDAVTEALGTVGAMAKRTFTPRVLTGLGSFGALFRADFSGYERPVLVSSTDGVGTKVLVARRLQRFDTLGEDLVNHCINDILVMGAEPLFFLDYVAAGSFPEGRLEALVSGFARACEAEGVALIGGETAEMPGVYGAEDFDLAGFIVGVVDEGAVLGPERVREGDVLLGMASSGLHTNGYSLAQRVVFDVLGLDAEDHLPGMDVPVGEALLATHRCYHRPLQGLLRDPALHALVHVTGGGFTDNLPRVLPEGLGAVVDRDAWTPPPLFRALAEGGPVTRDEMDRTFNMGVGMVLVVDAGAVEPVTAALVDGGEAPFVMGSIEAGDRRVRYTGGTG